MPPRDPELPEGTDQIVEGASGSSDASPSSGGGGSSGGSSGGNGGFVARSGESSSSGGSTTDKLVNQVREQVTSLRGQAGDKLRGLADDGKDRATGLLDDISAIIEDAARSIDDRLGQEYGDYAHRASGAVSSFAGRVRGKSVDDLLDDTRSVVRQSPAVAIAAAAVVGFALMRVVRTGLDEVGGGRSGRGKRGGGSGGGSSGGGSGGGGSGGSGGEG